MTIRQISEAAGCHIDTVRRLGKSMYPEVKAESRGYAIEYSKVQVLSIMEKLPKKNYVADPMQMCVPESMQMQTLPENGDTNTILIKLMENQQKMMFALMERMDSIENKSAPALPAPEKNERDILRQLINKYAKETFDGNHREAWNSLYEEIYFRKHFSLRKRAQTAGISKLDMIERLGLLSESIAIVAEIMGE